MTAMISKYTYKGLIWIDLESPTSDELAHVMEEYAIPESVEKEVAQVSDYSKVELYPKCIYLILHFPQKSHKKDANQEQEIDFIVGEKFMITVHYEFSHSLSEFSKKFEDGKTFEQKTDLDHIGILVYNLIKTLYSHSRRDLGVVSKMIKETEHEIFRGNGNKVATDLSNANHLLLDFRLALGFHRDVLESLENTTKQFFGDKFIYYFSAIFSEYKKTQAILENYKETLDNLRETNDSLLANKTNETIKILTIITFLISPVTVISSLFMMNTDFVLIKNPREFYIILAAMIISSILIFIYFKKRKWL
jgi:magnesium transporter